MAIITKITTQQKNQDRFNIFMDYGKGKGEEFAFSVDSDVLIKFQLKKGWNLTIFPLWKFSIKMTFVKLTTKPSIIYLEG